MSPSEPYQNNQDNLEIFCREYVVSKHGLMYKKSNSLVIIYRQLSDFLNNSVRVNTIKLKLRMYYHMNNTFRDAIFEITVDGPLFNTSDTSSLYIKHSGRLFNTFSISIKAVGNSVNDNLSIPISFFKDLFTIPTNLS